MTFHQVSSLMGRCWFVREVDNVLNKLNAINHLVFFHEKAILLSNCVAK